MDLLYNLAYNYRMVGGLSLGIVQIDHKYRDKDQYTYF